MAISIYLVTKVTSYLDLIFAIAVAQLGSSVVLKGEVATQEILAQLVETASRVSGASDVQSDEVSIG
ncbi:MULTISPECIES: hypothetical protein [unclassified Nostoc]|uniref:hypothetical protein n=1 Tax=unclassified Nostoc TaxID=2593658 RepID=UPI000B951F34|nr:hypothetical protein [Nostoc sp. 'Peltigera membranacea cyanobiont' 232]OYD99696.1 hypothetical protein CDG79_39480 [Nostoc sp. 'Peltigera membranacea cyanobiont' 232]